MSYPPTVKDKAKVQTVTDMLIAILNCCTKEELEEEEEEETPMAITPETPETEAENRGFRHSHRGNEPEIDNTNSGRRVRRETASYQKQDPGCGQNVASVRSAAVCVCLSLALS